MGWGDLPASQVRLSCGRASGRPIGFERYSSGMSSFSSPG